MEIFIKIPTTGKIYPVVGYEVPDKVVNDLIGRGLVWAELGVLFTEEFVSVIRYGKRI